MYGDKVFAKYTCPKQVLSSVFALFIAPHAREPAANCKLRQAPYKKVQLAPIFCIVRSVENCANGYTALALSAYGFSWIWLQKPQHKHSQQLMVRA